MPALGAGYGVLTTIPSNVFCSNWPPWCSLLIVFGSPTLFTVLELVTYVVKVRMNRTSLAESRMTKLMVEGRSDQATLKVLLAMLAAALSGVESKQGLHRGQESGISARPVKRKPRSGDSSRKKPKDGASLQGGPDP
jgi:hypothetical protein